MWLGGLRRRLPWLLMLLKVCMAVMLDERLKGLSGAVASDLYNAVYACTSKRNIVVVITGWQIKAKAIGHTRRGVCSHIRGACKSLQPSSLRISSHLKDQPACIFSCKVLPQCMPWKPDKADVQMAPQAAGGLNLGCFKAHDTRQTV